MKLVYHVAPVGLAAVTAALASVGSLACTAAQARQVTAGVLSAVSRGTAWLASLIDEAESGADLYFARHPDLDRERQVRAAVQAARGAMSLLTEVLAAVDAADDPRLEHVRAHALAAWGKLRQTLDDFGVIDARPPEGGAESDAPVPKKLPLPTREDVAARL